MATPPQPYLDPLNQAFANQLAGSPPLQDDSIAEVRQLFGQLQAHTPIPGATRTSFTVPFEAGVKTFLYKPDGATGALPVIIYLHGGGWIAGNVDTHDSIVRDLCIKTGAAVVFPEYTLAPEARFPTQNEQCYAVVKWVFQNGKRKGLLPSKLAIAGDSAGGQLAISTTILSRTRTPHIPISFQLLISPVTDLVFTDPETLSDFQFFNGPFLTVPFLRKSADYYIPDPADRTSELASPIKISAKDAKKQPPTLIVVSSADPLRDDGRGFGEILQEAGVSCAIVRAEGQVHDAPTLEAVRAGPTPRAMVELMAVELKGALFGEAADGVEKNGEQQVEEKVQKKTGKRRRVGRY